jgi:hypothetical protein
MKKLLLFSAVLAFGACKKSDDAAKGGAAGPSCEAAITKATAKLPAGSNPAATGVQERLKSVLIARCTEDKWPAEVITCYETASGMPGMKACREKLPPELANKAQAEIQRAMMLGAAAGAAGHGSAMKVPVPAGATGSAGGAMGAAGAAGGSAGSSEPPKP